MQPRNSLAADLDEALAGNTSRDITAPHDVFASLSDAERPAPSRQPSWEVNGEWNSAQVTMLLNSAFKVWTWREKALLKKQVDYFFKPGTKRQTTLKSLSLLIMWLDIKKMFATN